MLLLSVNALASPNTLYYYPMILSCKVYDYYSTRLLTESEILELCDFFEEQECGHGYTPTNPEIQN